ncbi:GGDEF domain-containing protein [Pseudomonas sp. PSKL.D1]|uniref:GGDEF domain-containing protein n=1 Tax=Pseudomonas sp. PSKL.D1 TaxID=3029060 RepID=UPI002381652E|nr:sensor domain-containing diguanylate cyclase [Pseudomonas sp. PSKL.D1]WDY60054.1 sensor domain-containing diguanylate cyclase [Pseudomonas sp. PSKL.D1]
MPKRPPLPDLRTLVLGIVLLACLATLGNSFYVAYRVQHNALVEFTLQANQAYASKVALSISEFLRSSRSHLAYSAGLLAAGLQDRALLQAEARRLQEQDKDFNSIVIADAQGQVLVAYPDIRQLTSHHEHSPELRQAVQARSTWISPAYTSRGGELVVLVAEPIHAPDGRYLGIVAGSVFLKKESQLHSVIGQHYQQDGTYAFVADANRRLLFHPDHALIGQQIEGSPTLAAALQGSTGSLDAPNYVGTPMLAGFAPVPEAHWAVVAQQPRALALTPLRELMRKMVLYILPASVVGFGLMLWMTYRLTRPLRQLAHGASHLSATETGEALRHVDAWYAEAAAIRSALLTAEQLLQDKFGKLRHEAHSDALTGLPNRRALQLALDTLMQGDEGFAVLALDIDHFKRVNDTYGHDAGDEVLQHLAGLMRQNSRHHDLPCRVGGEEFTMLLPGTELADARRIAERIRAAVEQADTPHVGTLTLSIGVACRQPGTEQAETVLKQADELLYKAKQNGRNRVEVPGLSPAPPASRARR